MAMLNNQMVYWIMMIGMELWKIMMIMVILESNERFSCNINGCIIYYLLAKSTDGHNHYIG